MTKFVYEVESSFVAGIIFWFIVSFLPGWRRRKKIRPKLELGICDVYRSLFWMLDCVMRFIPHSPSGFQKEIRANMLRPEDIELGLQNKCLNKTFLYDPAVSRSLIVAGGELFEMATKIDETIDRAFSFSDYVSSREILLLEQVRTTLHVYDLKSFDKPAMISIDGKPLAPVNPSLSYMKENFVQLYELFGKLQRLVFGNRYEDRGVLTDKIQGMCDQGRCGPCRRLLRRAEARFPRDEIFWKFHRFRCEYQTGNTAAACRTLDRILKAKPDLVSSRGFVADAMIHSDVRQVIDRYYTKEEIEKLSSVVREEAKVNSDFITQAGKLKAYYQDRANSL